VSDFTSALLPFDKLRVNSAQDRLSLLEERGGLGKARSGLGGIMN